MDRLSPRRCSQSIAPPIRRSTPRKWRQAGDGRSVGAYSEEVGAVLGLTVKTLRGAGQVDLRSVFLREARARYGVGLVHQGSESEHLSPVRKAEGRALVRS